MEDHPCRNSSIAFRDVNAVTIATYIKLCDGTYFGGNTYIDGPDRGPHVWHNLDSMLALLSIILDMPSLGLASTVTSIDVPPTVIAKHMNAETIAKIFQCTTDEVTHYFGIAITVGANNAD